MIKFFDIVEEVIEEATHKFSPFFIVDKTKFETLGTYCEVLDRVFKESDGESMEVEVDEDNMSIKISFECPDLIIKKDRTFAELIRRSVSFGFSPTQDGLLSVRFVFPSVWNKAV